jgi:hypothetical protein
MTDKQKKLQNIVKTHFFEKIILDSLCSSTFLDMIDSSKLKEGITCEHTSILRALIKYHQGNLEEIQQKTLQSSQEEPGGRQDRKAQNTPPGATQPAMYH